MAQLQTITSSGEQTSDGATNSFQVRSVEDGDSPHEEGLQRKSLVMVPPVAEGEASIWCQCGCVGRKKKTRLMIITKLHVGDDETVS